MSAPDATTPVLVLPELPLPGVGLFGSIPAEHAAILNASPREEFAFGLKYEAPFAQPISFARLMNPSRSQSDEFTSRYPADIELGSSPTAPRSIFTISSRVASADGRKLAKADDTIPASAAAST